MKVNNYDCDVYDCGEVYIQTSPKQLEANEGKVYLTILELEYLLKLARSTGEEAKNP